METHEIISRKTLCGCFSLLRQSLNNWQAGNLYFLNSHALYHHLSALPCGKDTVGGILTQMESCIPMALTTDSLEKFLLAKNHAEAEDFLESTKTDFLFLVSGIFRGYYLDVNGKEVTDCIGFKSGTPAMSSAIDNAISPISIEAVVESVFLRIDGAKLIPLIERSPLLLKIYNEVLQTAMQIHWALKVTVTQRTALERYQWFLENYPGLIDQVSNKHIASYLGMTPVTLSRMRRMMREREAVEKGVQET